MDQGYGPGVFALSLTGANMEGLLVALALTVIISAVVVGAIWVIGKRSR